MWTNPLAIDQNFWAAQIYQSQLGPAPATGNQLGADKLAACLKDLLTGKYRADCKEMGSKIAS